MELKIEKPAISTLSTFKKLLPFISAYKVGLIVAIVTLIMNALISTSLLSILKPLLDDGLGQSDKSFLKMIAFLVIFLFFLRGLTSFISQYCLSWVSGHVVMQLRRKLFAHIMNMPVSFFDQNSTGELLSRITYDSEQVSNASSDVLVTIVKELATILSLVGLMLYSSWQLSIIIFVLAPVIAGVIYFVAKIFKKISLNMQNTMGQIATSAEQMLKGHKVVLAYNGQKIEQDRFDMVSDDMRQHAMKMVKIESLSNPIIQLIASLALSVVLYLSASPEIIGNTLTVGTFGVIFSAMFALLQPLKNLAGVNSQLQRGMSACRTLFGILELTAEQDLGTYNKSLAKGDIVFTNVSFAYENQQELALRNVSFTIKAGSTVALVGKSGSGKSTISNLLMRFYEVEKGLITLDGVALKDFSLVNLRQQFALVSQNVYLFNDTIANNIAYAAADKYSRSDVENVAKLAYVTEFSDNLEFGLDTVIGENGVNLSGGQRQRIAIARALLRNTPILILDEATSALDTESEHIIQRALHELKLNRTSLVIAHRLSTIEKADLILVIDNGTIIEQGSHTELLKNNANYAQLYNMQFNN